MPSRPGLVRKFSEALSPGAAAPSPLRTNITEALNSGDAGSRGAFSYFDIPLGQGNNPRRNQKRTHTDSSEQSPQGSGLLQTSTSLGAGRRKFDGPQSAPTSSQSPRGRSRSLSPPPPSSSSSSDTTSYTQRIFGIPRQKSIASLDWPGEDETLADTGIIASSDKEIVLCEKKLKRRKKECQAQQSGKDSEHWFKAEGKRKQAFSEGSQTGMTPGLKFRDLNPFEVQEIAAMKRPGSDCDVAYSRKLPASSPAGTSRSSEKASGGSKFRSRDRQTSDQMGSCVEGKDHPSISESQFSQGSSETPHRRSLSRSEDWVRSNSDRSLPVGKLPPSRRPGMPWRRTASNIKIPEIPLSTLEQEFLDSPRIPHSPPEIGALGPDSPTFFPSEARNIIPAPEKARKFFFDQRSPSGGMSSSDWNYSTNPSLLEKNANQNWFRVKLQGVNLDAETDYSIPEHLPTSPLCPRHPKHRSGGKGVCVYHGGNMELPGQPQLNSGEVG